MRDSNFWFYTIMILVIGHIIVGFIYLMIKLSPKKKDKEENNEQE
jgi:uncharacterized membrane protein SirB2